MRKLFIFVLLVLIAAKVAALLASGPATIERDAFGYWKLSALVMGGDVLMTSEPIAYRTPGYPWFLAALRLPSGPLSLMVIAVAQAVLSVASIFIAGIIAARITKLPRAMPWTLAVSLPAVSAYTYNVTVLSEPLFTFLLMLHLLAVLDYAKHDSAGRAVWVGITFAAALLTRPVIMLLWVPHVLFLLMIHFRRWRTLGKQGRWRLKLHQRLVHGIAAGLTILVLCAPWMMRNYSTFGQPFLTEFLGRNAWVVTFQDGSGAGLDLPSSDASTALQQRLNTMGAMDGIDATWTVSDALVRSGLDDAQADRLMRQVSLDAIDASQSNQEAFAYKAFRRVCNFWRCAATDLPESAGQEGNYRGQWIWNSAVPQVESFIEFVKQNRWSNSVLLNTILAGILGVAVLVLLINGPTRPHAFWLLMIFAYFSVVTGILEIPAYRYRMVLEPMVAMTIGAAIAVVLARRRKPVEPAG